jgi:hypothetical protein
MDNEEYNEYENQIEDIDEVKGTDVKINADYYIHRTLDATLDALKNPNIKDGLIQYRMLIEHLETLADSSKLLTNDYKDNLEKYKQSKEFAEEKEDFARNMKLSNKKLSLLTKEVFSNKVATNILKA